MRDCLGPLAPSRPRMQVPVDEVPSGIRRDCRLPRPAAKARPSARIAGLDRDEFGARDHGAVDVHDAAVGSETHDIDQFELVGRVQEIRQPVGVEVYPSRQ